MGMRVKSAVIAGLAVILVSLATTDAHARIFGRRGGGGGNTGAHMEYVETAESTEKLYYEKTMSLQDIAQERANAMAERQTLDHNIHTYVKVKSWTGVGVSEGIGYSAASDPKHVATCICGNRVVADAFCRAANGVIYRVRFFRN